MKFKLLPFLTLAFFVLVSLLMVQCDNKKKKEKRSPYKIVFIENNLIKNVSDKEDELEEVAKVTIFTYDNIAHYYFDSTDMNYYDNQDVVGTIVLQKNTGTIRKLKRDNSGEFENINMIFDSALYYPEQEIVGFYGKSQNQNLGGFVDESILFIKKDGNIQYRNNSFGRAEFYHITDRYAFPILLPTDK
jgi:uncharacterized protein YcfL